MTEPQKCPACAELEHKLAQILGRLGGSERARHHLEEENRRLALDLYRATARFKEPEEAK